MRIRFQKLTIAKGALHADFLLKLMNGYLGEGVGHRDIAFSNGFHLGTNKRELPKADTTNESRYTQANRNDAINLGTDA